jgi:NADPH-dependent glutamate synthase beta subunit-like oxidoreductase
MNSSQKIAIIGGGYADMAAVSLAQRGVAVTVHGMHLLTGEVHHA